MGPKVLMTAKTLATPGLALLEQAGCAVSFLKEGTEAELAESLRSTPFDAVISRTLALPAIMNRIVTKIIEIDGGALTTYSGDYGFYEEQRALNERQLQAQFERQQAMLAKEIKFIERFRARASHASQVQSRVKKLEKIDRVEPPRRRQTVSFEFLPAPRSGEDVVNLRNVHKAYGSRAIYEGLDFMTTYPFFVQSLGSGTCSGAAVFWYAAFVSRPRICRYATSASISVTRVATPSKALTWVSSPYRSMTPDACSLSGTA